MARLRSANRTAMLATVTVGWLLAAFPGLGAERMLLNVSYDPTREFFQDYDGWFAQAWRAKTGDSLEVRRSHGGSAKQARSVMEGLSADVVTLALGYDIDMVAAGGVMLATNWQSRLPLQSSPYGSVIVFLVRKGNPKRILDWADLVRPGVEVVVPNPKTSGGARWVYLAAWAAGERAGVAAGRTNAGRNFVKGLYRNVKVLDTGARGATTTFVQRQMGDVLITWENEAHLAVKETGDDSCQIIAPSFSIAAQPPVAWVDRVVRRKRTLELAKAYLEGLYTPAAQEIAARHFFRPTDPDILNRYRAQFPAMATVTVEGAFGGWARAHETHFREDGVFDQIQRELR